MASRKVAEIAKGGKNAQLSLEHLVSWLSKRTSLWGTSHTGCDATKASVHAIIM